MHPHILAVSAEQSHFYKKAGIQDGTGRIPELKSSYDNLSVVIICLDGRDAMDSKGSLHGFLGTLLSPDMSVDEKREVLVRDYGMGMEQELGEGLGQMCNLSEAIEEREDTVRGLAKESAKELKVLRLWRKIC